MTPNGDSSHYPDVTPLSVLVGVVKSTIDFTETGMIKVDIRGHGVINVNYTTPYYANSHGGGFWALPTEGTQVLVCCPSNRKSTWYYMGSVTAPNISDISKLAGDKYEYSDVADALGVNAERTMLPIEQLQNQSAEGVDAYKARFRPMKYVFTSPLGQGLTIYDQYDTSSQATDAFYNQKVELKSKSGQRIELNDSQHVNNIVLANKDGDAYHRITNGMAEPAQAAASQDFHSRLNETHFVQNGLFQLWVQDGKNIEIVNTSTGSQRAYIPPPMIGIVPEDVGSWGKILLRTLNNDIEIFAGMGASSPMEDLPSVRITTAGSDSVIQLDSAGRVSIVAASGINLTTEAGDITLSATTGSINLKAPQGLVELQE